MSRELRLSQRVVCARRDVASLNALGYCSIEGRIKDMIIRGGENIYPAEVEKFLYTNDKVHEVQVPTANCKFFAFGFCHPARRRFEFVASVGI